MLRRLEPRPLRVGYVSVQGERIDVIIETETMGFDRPGGEVIEFGMVAFTSHDSGQIGEVIDVSRALRKPSGAIIPEITRLTGSLQPT